MLEGNITITKKEYFELRCDKEWRERLDTGGIDTWEWFEECMNPDYDISWDEFVNKLRKEIDIMKEVNKND